MEIKEVNDEVPSSGTNKPNSDPSSSSSIKVEGFEADEEKRLVNKLDRLILPLAAFLYLSAYLDRGNIGNAKLQGMKADVLDNNDTEFSVVLCAFYISYIVFSIPGTILSRAIRPSMSISAGVLIWSLAAGSMAACQSYPAVVVCRLFIGLGEALFGQALVLYFSIWYRKNEVSQRLALYVGAGTLAGAFGGLIAFGVAHIQGSLAHWRMLFLIEGLPSVLLAVVVYFCLPSKPKQTRYLNDRERFVLESRLRKDGLFESDSRLDWNGVRRSFKDWKSYVMAVLFACLNLTLGSVSGFLPTIIASLGYTNASAQLHTVPPYAVSLVFMVTVATISDKFSTRGIPIASVCGISSIGWIILSTVHENQKVRYFATFCVVIGGYAAMPLVVGWVSNNSPSQSQRATTLGIINSVGHCLSIASAFLFPESDKPRWKKGTSVNLAFNLLGITLALGMSIYFRLENHRRNALVSDSKSKPIINGSDQERIHRYDLEEDFRYVP